MKLRKEGNMNEVNKLQVEAVSETESIVSGLVQVDSDQLLQVSKIKFFQEALVVFEGETFFVKWDGEYLRLLKPFGVNMDQSLVTYKVLGHIEMGVTLPKNMDLETFERQANVLISAYKDNVRDDQTSSEV